MEAKLRKQESILAISGLAVVVFGVWDMISAIVTLVLSRETVVDASVESYGRWAAIATVVITILAELISVGLRAYIGFTARSFGRGKDKGVGFLIVTGILLVINVISAVGTVILKTGSSMTVFSRFMSVFVSLTAIFTLGCLMIAGIRVKILRRAQ